MGNDQVEGIGLGDIERRVGFVQERPHRPS